MLKPDEQFDLAICNPPFHSSEEEAQAGSARKVKNLKRKPTEKVVLNFGGQHKELWCEGGEKRFIGNMIRQSAKFPTSCFWYSSLVSKQSHVTGLVESIRKAGALDVRTIPMGQGNKTSRIIAWTFLDEEQQGLWVQKNW